LSLVRRGHIKTWLGPPERHHPISISWDFALSSVKKLELG